MEGLPGAKAILKWSTQWTQETIYQTSGPTTYFIKLFTTYFITAWLAGSGAAGLSGLDGVSGLADRERHAYMDKKCDAYLFSSPQHRLQHRPRLQLKSTLLHSSKARAAVSTFHGIAAKPHWFSPAPKSIACVLKCGIIPDHMVGKVHVSYIASYLQSDSEQHNCITTFRWHVGFTTLLHHCIPYRRMFELQSTFFHDM